MNYKAPRHGYLSYRPSGRNFRRSGLVYRPYVVNQHMRMDQTHPYTSLFAPSNDMSAAKPPKKSLWQRISDTFGFGLLINDTVAAIIGWLSNFGASTACLCCMLLALIVGNAIAVGIGVGVTVGLYDRCCSSCHDTPAIVAATATPDTAIYTSLLTTALSNSSSGR